jgi:hypothetical protein
MRSSRFIVETVGLATMAAGILMVWQPFLHELFRWGFTVTLVGIVAFMVGSHLPAGGRRKAP